MEQKNSEGLAQAVSSASVESAALQRAQAYGAAAACAAILLGIAQSAGTSDALRFAAGAAAIGAPLQICVAQINEYYLALGKRSLPHVQIVVGAYALLSLAAYGLVAVSIAAVAFHVSTTVGWLMVMSTALAVGISGLFHRHLAAWMAKHKDAPVEN